MVIFNEIRFIWFIRKNKPYTTDKKLIKITVNNKPIFHILRHNKNFEL
jgi:hypothetical protein